MKQTATRQVKMLNINILLVMSTLLIALGGCSTIEKQSKKIADNPNPFQSDLLPVAPHANKDVTAILKYLDALPKRENAKCLTGQDIGVRGEPELAKTYFQKSVVELDRVSGHRPAVLEYATFHDTGRWLTLSEQESMQKEIIERSREGHLIYLNLRPAHPAGIPLMLEEGIPVWANVVANGKAPGFHLSVDSVIKPEGKYYKAYREILDYAANYMKPLEKDGVPLLFEIFNEFNGNWNWFGKAEPEEFKKLWRYTYHYFAHERKFTNLLFVLEYNSNTLIRENDTVGIYYPGDDCVDILGFDFYHSNPGDKYVGIYNELCAIGKPVAMAEYGPQLRDYRKMHKVRVGEAVNIWDNMVQVEFTKTHYPKCCFFIRWGFDWAMISQNNPKEFMNDPLWANLEHLKRDRLSFAR
ncbi:MAG: hypothetical protein HQL32_08310 [Planctomycetes bacterium]|nr:hypothetical protein [Planctomycetota bacterium]